MMILFSTIPKEILKQGGFCPFSKNSRPPSKKLNAMEATLGIKKKTQIFLKKISRTRELPSVALVNISNG